MCPPTHSRGGVQALGGAIRTRGQPQPQALAGPEMYVCPLASSGRAGRARAPRREGRGRRRGKHLVAPCCPFLTLRLGFCAN